MKPITKQLKKDDLEEILNDSSTSPHQIAEEDEYDDIDINLIEMVKGEVDNEMKGIDIMTVESEDMTSEEKTAALREELRSLENFKVKSDILECEMPPGSKIIDSIVVWTRKPDRVKARIVARDFNLGDKRLDTYASTPSTLSLKILMSIAATRGLSIVTADL